MIRSLNVSEFRLLTTIMLVAFLTGLVAAFAPIHVSAADTPQSGTIAQGFQADETGGEITGGTIVSLKNDTTKTVRATSPENSDRLVGVVDNKPLLTISSSSKEAQVVISGSTSVLVSDINGAIAVGDSIAPSPIAGVGMKATENGQVVGIAGSTSKNGKKVTVTDKEGVKHTVTIGRANIQVNVSRFQASGSDLLPSAIQNAANGIAGRNVTSIRVLIALAVFIIGFSSVLMIVFASVRSSVTSIGRNPLAAKDIRRGLYQVLVIALVLAVAAGLAGYLIIRI